MYQTQLDDVVRQLKTDIFNHKFYRPQIYYNNNVIRHLLFPDVPTYIFNFVFDATQASFDSKNPYTIDIFCQEKYGTSNAYQLLMFINGLTGIQDCIPGIMIFLPNRLVEFINKYRSKYDSYIEDQVEIPQELLYEEKTYTSSAEEQYVEYLTQVFGGLYMEA